MSTTNGGKDRSLGSPSNLRRRKRLDNQNEGAVKPVEKESDEVKRWKNWNIRTTFTLLMIGGFFAIMAAGPIPVLLLVLFVQGMMYKEVISLSTIGCRMIDLPGLTALNWYFLLSIEYFLYGTILHKQIKFLPNSKFFEMALSIQAHHRFVSFSLYLVGMIWFVATLRKGYYRFQFGNLAWTHMALLLIIFQGHFMVKSAFEGLFWFFIPISLVIVNDIFAYIFGFFFGRHRLIELSPKKTWEGFIGGAFATMLFGFLFTAILGGWSYWTCPIQSLKANVFNYVACKPNPVFIPTSYRIPGAIVHILKHIGIQSQTVMIRPVQLHSLVFTAFASLIAPFGGFFASGVKRAFKIKDFGDYIPGHGGFTDRFDCQFFMAGVSYLYYTTFIRVNETTVEGIITLIVTKLSPERQLEVFYMLAQRLEQSGITQFATATNSTGLPL